MKQALQAAAAVALVVGLAAAAQAEGIYQKQGAAQMTNRHAAAMHTQQRGTVGREQIREAQQQLKSEGMFKGRVDGRNTHQFKIALSHFQQQNGLKRTGRLDEKTLAQLNTGGGATQTQTGVGSSMPNRTETATPPTTPMNPSPPATAPSGAGTAPSSTTPGNIGAPKQP